MKKCVYSNEFKEQAVHLSHQRENIKELADELDINILRLYKWRTWVNSRTTAEVKVTTPEESYEVIKLRKALSEKELEREILKKAVHIFSKSDGKSTNL